MVKPPLKRPGILYSLNFLFGMDEDTPDIFDETMAFLKTTRTPMAFFNTITPRSGTPMRSKLENEGRIINPAADRYLGMECIFKPKNMSARYLEERVWNCFRDFYSLPAILKRFLLPPNAYFVQGFPSNLIFWWAAQRRKDPVDFY